MGFVKPGQDRPWLTNTSYVRLDELEVPAGRRPPPGLRRRRRATATASPRSPLARAAGPRPSPAAPTPTRTATGPGSNMTGRSRPEPTIPEAIASGPPAGCPRPRTPTRPSSTSRPPGRWRSSTRSRHARASTFATPRRWPGCPDRAQSLRRPRRGPVRDRPGRDQDRAQIRWQPQRHRGEALSQAGGSQSRRKRSGADRHLGGLRHRALSKSANKPLSMTDARGNTTTLDLRARAWRSADRDRARPWTACSRPQKRYSYVQRTRPARRRKRGRAAGLAARPHVHLPDGQPGHDRPGCALGAADEVVTSYDYGPDTGPTNLLLLGQSVTADGTTLRTCYAYDGQGRKISETSPGGTAGLAACPASAPTGRPAVHDQHPLRRRRPGDGDDRARSRRRRPTPLARGPQQIRCRGPADPGRAGRARPWQPDTVAPADWTGFPPASGGPTPNMTRSTARPARG